MHAVLALDQGGHASRACILDETGAIVAQQQVAVTTRHLDAVSVEHDADELAASLRQAAEQVLTHTDASLQIDGVGLATQRSTVVCFDRRTHAALSPALSWQDRRHAAWLNQFAPREEAVRSLTGLPLSPHYGVSKLRWCVDHLPAVRQAREEGQLCAAPLAAFLLDRLSSGGPAVDAANASRTLLWDINDRAWSPELTTLFGIDAGWLPPSVPTQGHFGTLPLCGLELPLTALTGDQSGVPYAFGAPEQHCAYINLGTGAFIQCPLPSRPTLSAPLLCSVLAADARRAWYSLEGTVNGAGAATAWYAQHCGREEASLWQQLEGFDAQRARPLFLNGIGGLGSPYWRASWRSHFVGEGDERAEFAAVVESIVFLIAVNLHWLARLHNGVRRVLLTGGLSRSDWLCRHLASALALPVARLTQEASVRGVAALAAPALAQYWPMPRAQWFEPERDDTLLERYRLFRAALDTHSP